MIILHGHYMTFWQCREQEDSVAALKQVNEEARQTRLMALDERTKVRLIRATCSTHVNVCVCVCVGD